MIMVCKKTKNAARFELGQIKDDIYAKAIIIEVLMGTTYSVFLTQCYQFCLSIISNFIIFTVREIKTPNLVISNLNEKNYGLILIANMKNIQ